MVTTLVHQPITIKSIDQDDSPGVDGVGSLPPPISVQEHAGVEGACESLSYRQRIQGVVPQLSRRWWHAELTKNI